MSGLDCRHLSFVPGNDDWLPHPDPAQIGQGHPDFVEMVPFVRFDRANGAITDRGAMARAHVMRERLMTGSTLPGVGHSDTHYVDIAEMKVAEKAACPAVLDGLVLRGLPRPCRIEISSPLGPPVLYDWSDAALTLSFEHPGRYTVRVLSVPHLPGVFEVTVNG